MTIDNKKEINISNFSDLNIWKIEADQDAFLKDYYVEIPAYKELINTNKFWVVWRKWTWKTALKQMFFDRVPSYDFFVEDFKFSSIFTPSFFDDLVNNYQDQWKSYIDLIKYVLLIRLMLLINKNEWLDSNFKSDINNFLLINWYKIDNITSLYNTIKEENHVKISSEVWFGLQLWFFNAKWKISKDKKVDNIVDIDYRKILDPLFDLVLSKLDNKCKYVLLIDKIDDLWTTYFEIYDNVVLNFIKAIIDINGLIRKHLWQENKSRVIIFLREDLLNRLRWKDANFNKFMQDELIRIDWQASYGSDNWLLNDLINKRISKALELQGLSTDNYEKPFINNILLNSSILQPMKIERYENYSQEAFIKRVFYNRTYLRPRDVVKYFHFLSIAYDRSDFQDKYSEYLWEEIGNELYPILYDVERTKMTLRKICQRKTWRFKSSDFIKIYKEQNYRNIKADDDINLTAQETLEILYKYSVIWNRSIETINKINYRTWENFTKITDVRFKYRENNKIDFDIDKECIIHAWLYQALWIQS